MTKKQSLRIKEFIIAILASILSTLIAIMVLKGTNNVYYTLVSGVIAILVLTYALNKLTSKSLFKLINTYLNQQEDTKID